MHIEGRRRRAFRARSVTPCDRVTPLIDAYGHTHARRRAPLRRHLFKGCLYQGLSFRGLSPEREFSERSRHLTWSLAPKPGHDNRKNLAIDNIMPGGHHHHAMPRQGCTVWRNPRAQCVEAVIARKGTALLLWLFGNCTCVRSAEYARSMMVCLAICGVAASQ